MRPLVEEGRVLMIRPPWGEVVAAADARRIALAWSEEELRSLSATHGSAATARRFRGLACFDDSLLARSCVAAATRRTEHVSVAAAESIALVLGE
jgi:DNA gyrase/topoisomerase IV subunit B